jgi:Na+-driven multidrug efflux pump
MLDRLRWIFPYAVALALPLAGAVLAAVRYADGDRDEALRLAAAALLGLCLYALLFTR